MYKRVDRSQIDRETNFVRVGIAFLAISALYLGIQLLGIYIDYRAVKVEVATQLARAGINDPAQIKEYFLIGLGRKKLDLSEAIITIEKEDRHARFKVNFEDQMSYFGVPLYKFRFKIDEQVALE